MVAQEKQDDFFYNYEKTLNKKLAFDYACMNSVERDECERDSEFMARLAKEKARYFADTISKIKEIYDDADRKDDTFTKLKCLDMQNRTIFKDIYEEVEDKELQISFDSQMGKVLQEDDNIIINNGDNQA